MLGREGFVGRMVVPRNSTARRRSRRQLCRRCASTSRRWTKQAFVGCQRPPPRLLQRWDCGAQKMGGHGRQHRSGSSFDRVDAQGEGRVGRHGELADCVGALPQRSASNTERDSAGDLFFVGSTLASRGRRSRLEENEEIKTMVYAELKALGLCSANSFERWYQKMDTPLSRDDEQCGMARHSDLRRRHPSTTWSATSTFSTPSSRRRSYRQKI